VLRRFFAILVPVLTTLIFGSWNVIIGPLLPEIAQTFNMKVEYAGLLLAINFAGAIMSVLVGGILADRYGKKRIFLVAMGGFTVAAYLYAIGNSFAMIAAICLLGGALGGSLEGLCGAIIADADPQHSSRNMNMLQIAFSAGAVLALVLTSLLKKNGVSWRSEYLTLGCVATPIFLLSLFMSVPPAPQDAPISPRIIRRVVTDPLMVLLIVAIAFYVGAEMGLAQWISRILGKGGTGDSTAVLAPALFWGMTGVGRFASGLLCHYHPALRVLKWLLIGGLLSFVVLLLPHGQWPLWIGTGLAGLTFSGVWPLIVSQGSGRYPAYSGTTVALMVVAGNIGGMIFPPLIGFPVERLSPWWGLLFTGLLFIGLTITITLYHRALQQRSPASLESVPQ
jgi:fucose permease